MAAIIWHLFDKNISTERNVQKNENSNILCQKIFVLNFFTKINKIIVVIFLHNLTKINNKYVKSGKTAFLTLIFLTRKNSKQ